MGLRPRLLRWNSAAITLSLLLGAVAFQASVVTQAARASSSGTVTFSFTGADQTWTVPAGITALRVDVRGAQGQGGVWSGPGGRVLASLPVTAGEALTVVVGGSGSIYGGGGQATGDTGAFAGGGASDVRQGGSGTANRIVVAGGGGAAGQYASDVLGAGGAGGGPAGQPGTDGSCVSSGGGGGTQTGGGAGGSGLYSPGGAGALASGGPSYGAYAQWGAVGVVGVATTVGAGVAPARA